MLNTLDIASSPFAGVEERSEIRIVERSGPQHHYGGIFTETVAGYFDGVVEFDKALMTGQIPMPYGIDPDPLQVRTWYEGERQCFVLTYVAYVL